MIHGVRVTPSYRATMVFSSLTLLDHLHRSLCTTSLEAETRSSGIGSCMRTLLCGIDLYESWSEQFEGCVHSVLGHHSASPVRNVTLRILLVLELLTWSPAGVRAARIERTVVHCRNVGRLWRIVHRRASAECHADRDTAELRDEVTALTTSYLRWRIGTCLRNRALPLTTWLLG